MTREALILKLQTMISNITAMLDALKRKLAMEGQTENSLNIYRNAKALLGKHLTLNINVPAELGCAEAVSYVLNKCGVRGIPPRGIEGTRQLKQFLDESYQFIKVATPAAGDIAVYPTSIEGFPHGHTFVVGKVQWMSNNSDNGKWEANYTSETAHNYYVKDLGLLAYFYRMI